MDPVELAADDLLLRCWRPADADAVHRACQDEEIRRWTTVPSPYTAAEATRFVTGAAEAWTTGTGTPFGVFDAATGDLLGATGLHLAPERRGAEIGYWTAPWSRGRHVAERAGRLVARWGFDTLGLRRLDWRAVVGNHTSRLIALRLGMRMEGVVRSGLRPHGADGDPVDGWVAGMLPGELRDAGPDDAVLTRAARQARAYGAAQPTVDAGHLVLRPVAGTDVDHLVATGRDPESVANTGMPVPYQETDAESFVRLGADLWRRGDGAVYAAAAPTGRFLGTFELRLDRYPARLGEVGYSVAPWARGRGVATTALRALCDWAYEALALDRIEWRAAVTNPASRRVAEKAGFTVEGTERGRHVQRGVPVDTWYGARLSTDPAALRE